MRCPCRIALSQLFHVGDDGDLLERRIRADGAVALLVGLFDREQEVMRRLIAGKLNKVIADEFGIAVCTAEAHRARLFEKMGVRSALELVKLLASMDGIPGPSKQKDA